MQQCRMQGNVAPSAPFFSSGLVTLPSSSAPATLLAVCDVPVLTLRRVARKRHLRRIRHAFVFSQRAALPAGGLASRLQRQGRTWESRRGAPAREGAGWRGRRLSTLALLSPHASEDELAKFYITLSSLQAGWQGSLAQAQHVQVCLLRFALRGGPSNSQKDCPTGLQPIGLATGCWNLHGMPKGLSSAALGSAHLTHTSLYHRWARASSP